jgi:hypothetical protein
MATGREFRKFDDALVEKLRERIGKSTSPTKPQPCHDVPMGRVRRPRDVLSSDVLLDRGFFHPRGSDLGMISVPSLPFGPAAGGRVDRPSPQLSADQPG